MSSVDVQSATSLALLLAVCYGIYAFVQFVRRGKQRIEDQTYTSVPVSDACDTTYDGPEADGWDDWDDDEEKKGGVANFGGAQKTAATSTDAPTSSARFHDDPAQYQIQSLPAPSPIVPPAAKIPNKEAEADDLFATLGMESRPVFASSTQAGPLTTAKPLARRSIVDFDEAGDMAGWHIDEGDLFS